MRFCGSSKNLNSVDNISEEIDLDDINDDDVEENDKIVNNKNFVLTSFDELDDEEKSDSDSIGEIYKKTTETIKAIQLRNKYNNKDNNKENDLDKKKENNNKLNEEIDHEKKNHDNKNEKSNCNEEKKIDIEKKDILKKVEEKKINEMLKKSNEKIKNNLFLEKDTHNSLPLIKSESEKNFKKNRKLSDGLNDNPEISSKVNVKSIFDYKDKKINVLPKIRMKMDEPDHGRYFYRDTSLLSKTGYNLNDKINNFRSNNIIKTKENKDCSLFNSLRKSSENGANYKYKIKLLNHIKLNDQK